ncbi:putative ribonuclease H protein [Senna tora]|uniref:Putative ribonuclease H protein n=1 Tax=Senna tora TaxID=362788 RepID=A0A834SDV2_9FABA|nr:putative ribonuclease H protein [Senna tora]
MLLLVSHFEPSTFTLYHPYLGLSKGHLSLPYDPPSSHGKGRAPARATIPATVVSQTEIDPILNVASKEIILVIGVHKLLPKGFHPFAVPNGMDGRLWMFPTPLANLIVSYTSSLPLNLDHDSLMAPRLKTIVSSFDREPTIVDYQTPSTSKFQTRLYNHKQICVIHSEITPNLAYSGPKVGARFQMFWLTNKTVKPVFLFENFHPEYLSFSEDLPCKLHKKRLIEDPKGPNSQPSFQLRFAHLAPINGGSHEVCIEYKGMLEMTEFISVVLPAMKSCSIFGRWCYSSCDDLGHLIRSF